MAPPGPDRERLTEEERSFLRDLARRAVTAAVAGEPSPDARDLARVAGLPWEPRLGAPRGAFVTLLRHGALRGCIGHIEGHLPLAEAVAHNGRAAALSDPRFAPVAPPELAGLELEISVLSPLVPVASAREIVLGRHGIVLEKNGRKAVFLPQVAPEQGWNLATTLGHLARKAGLEADEWRTGARFRVFEADVF